jgi:hypothetical protein
MIETKAVHVMPLDWSDAKAHIAAIHHQCPKIDIIIGSDVVYVYRLIQPLCDVIAALQPPPKDCDDTKTNNNDITGIFAHQARPWLIDAHDRKVLMTHSID